MFAEEGARAVGDVHHGDLEEEGAPIAHLTKPQAAFLRQLNE